MKIPGPDHPIAISPNPRTVRVALGGAVVAETSRALSLQEASYPAVQYIPRADIPEGVLTRTAKTSHCPYKGDAAYWTVAAGGEERPDAAWSYETPFPAMREIAGHVAFYPDKVTVEEVS